MTKSPQEQRIEEILRVMDISTMVDDGMYSHSGKMLKSMFKRAFESFLKDKVILEKGDLLNKQEARILSSYIKNGCHIARFEKAILKKLKSLGGGE